MNVIVKYPGIAFFNLFIHGCLKLVLLSVALLAHSLCVTHSVSRM